ncbi:cation efflux system protein [Sulfurihydrogenibium azorense Az-Fu1]|uniref:Cation efflux system protein n=1 Tax=Sulfurihydrogenibium azorense (strain DSM 15241 / OCM 825 / Az-Fu1) TaxID=204536 RepID=C1DUC8_SULAA|nr:CusA/CzcA family heavy metal efflux RND transporter [Sulfurihydrogenibium azorense]ACN98521.1 cation efflux system protein [Sulfurihydrogenibium azorense Az-Fu1]
MHKVFRFVIENAVAILLINFILIVSAIFIVRQLNIEVFPDPSPPIVEIVTVYEGRSAEEVEKQVTIPLEVALAGMPGFENIYSISLYGLSDIKCRFSFDVSYKEARQEVLNRLSQVNLPPNVSPSINPSPIGEVMRYKVKGNRSLVDLRTIQDWIVARNLQTVPGVATVSSYGGYIKAYSVIVHPEKLIEYKIPLSQVIDQLSKSNINVGGRVLEFGDQFYNIRGIGLIKNISDIENTVVGYKNNIPILVKNIADSQISHLPRTAYVGLNRDDDIVMGVVVLRKNEKSIPALKALHEKIDYLNKVILPKDVKVIPFYDKQELIDKVIHKITETAITGIILVLVVILIFLGEVRSAIIVASIIPISLLYTLSVMAINKESANLLSIGAIDFGIIVDIPLIFIENYFRLKEEGKNHIQALYENINQIFKPILFSMIIILLAFIPLFTMKGSESQIFMPMAKTYIYALLFALVLTFTYLLAGSYLFLKNSHERKFKFFTYLENFYLSLMEKINVKVAIISTVAVFILSVILFKSLGAQFLPKMDEGNIYARIIFPYTISLKKSYENAKEVRDILLSFPEVQQVEFQVGRPEDGTDPSGPFNSEYFVKLKDYDKWTRNITKEELEKEIREKIRQKFPNFDINLSQYIQDNLDEAMSGVKGENSVKIFGSDLKILTEKAHEVADRIKKVPGIVDVGIFEELGQPNLIIQVDREKASLYNLTVEDVLDVIQSSLNGRFITQVMEEDKFFDLVIKFPDKYRDSIEDIKNIPIILQNGSLIPISKVANIYYDTGASFIYRENYRRYIPIKFSVESKDLAGTVAKAQEAVKDIKLPEGYFISWSGQFEQMEKAFERLKVSIGFTLFIIVIVLFIINSSIKNTFIILMSPLYAVFGGLLFLLIWKEPISVSASVGFISILGIAVLNANIMLSTYSNFVRSGIKEEEAIKMTVKEKFRSILITGLTASVGLLPASLSQGVGSQVQKPLAVVVVGGMFLGTILLLLFFPKLLKYAEVKES